MTSKSNGTYPTAIKLHKTRPPIETIARSPLTFDSSSSMRRDSSSTEGSTRPASRIREFSVVEITGTTTGPVWGTDIYTEDSNIAAAAVLAGLVAVGQKRWIGIEVVKSPNRFGGSERNGVVSMQYDFFTTAIRLREVPLRVSNATGTMEFVIFVARGERGKPKLNDLAAGKPVAVVIVEVTGSAEGAVWGTDVYTADSRPNRRFNGKKLDIDTSSVAQNAATVYATTATPLLLLPADLQQYRPGGQIAFAHGAKVERVSLFSRQGSRGSQEFTLGLAGDD